jgi:hypothetical protein
VWRFYFGLHGGTIRTLRVIEFLKALQATIGEKLLIIWDYESGPCDCYEHRHRMQRQHWPVCR